MEAHRKLFPKNLSSIILPGELVCAGLLWPKTLIWYGAGDDHDKIVLWITCLHGVKWMYGIPISQAAFCPCFLFFQNTWGFEGRRKGNWKKISFLIFWENILSECELLMKLRGETKTGTHKKEWDHESELIADFWSLAEFRCGVPLFPCWALPTQGQGLSHWIQLLEVSPY